MIPNHSLHSSHFGLDPNNFEQSVIDSIDEELQMVQDIQRHRSCPICQIFCSIVMCVREAACNTQRMEAALFEWEQYIDLFHHILMSTDHHTSTIIAPYYHLPFATMAFLFVSPCIHICHSHTYCLLFQSQ